MNDVDKQYLHLLEEIIRFGDERNTRAGEVLSLFGKQLRFDLQEGFPLLTTKKVFTKGIIHELLWFLQRPYNSHGSMNIEYLVRNGVHIWDDDAYRWFKSEISNKQEDIRDIVVCVSDDEKFPYKKPSYEYWIERDSKIKDQDWLKNITKEEFLELTLQKVEIKFGWAYSYRFGDLGPVYGKQWRSFGNLEIDQIQNIIETLKTNPFDRRILCIAFNPEQLDEMALPPCHVMFQFYARKLGIHERLKLLTEINPGHTLTHDELDELGIPKYGLSCMWTQRSVDCCAGLPFNIASYALLTHIIAREVNMIPDELIGSLGDCHIYKNHIDGAKEQLSRVGYNNLPTLKIREVGSLEDLTIDDIQILNYECDPPIKFQLNVG